MSDAEQFPYLKNAEDVISVQRGPEGRAARGARTGPSGRPCAG